MTRRERLIHIAGNAATNVDPTNCEFLVGAVVAHGNRVISTGCCMAKTHPRNPKRGTSTHKKQLCAEVSAILRALSIVSKRRIHHCTVYVTRRRRDGSYGMAKPCSHCQTFLRENGIKKAFYTTNLGGIDSIRI